VRAVASLPLAGLASLAVLLAGEPARAQCYPGLACPTDQGQQPQPPSSGGTGTGTGTGQGAKSRTQTTEYYFVGPVSPPDDWLALRTAPSGDTGTRIMKMPEGTMFKVLEKRDKWFYVQLQDGKTGWAHSNWIKCCKYVNE
jgi:Bacterial SH3 domain